MQQRHSIGSQNSQEVTKAAITAISNYEAVEKRMLHSEGLMEQLSQIQTQINLPGQLRKRTTPITQKQNGYHGGSLVIEPNLLL
jgi:hypothetical protein